MAYSTDGSPHYDGIKNEREFDQFIISHGQNSKMFEGISSVESAGGTKTKTDSKIIFSDGRTASISSKHSKGNTGTFDWVNCGSDIPSTKNYNPKKAIEQFKLESKNDPLDLKKTSFKRKRLELSQNYFNEFDNKIIFDLLTKFLDPIKTQIVVINCKTDKQYYCFYGHNHPVFEFLNNSQNYTFFAKHKRIKKASKESICLFVRDNSTGEEHDLFLRFRLVTNNGDSAAVGLNNGNDKKNKNSYFSLKLQQENVKQLVLNLKAKNQLESLSYKE